MRAFLKRRWILLSCAVVLLACSVVDCVFEWVHRGETGEGLVSYAPVVYFVGVAYGQLGAGSPPWPSVAVIASGKADAAYAAEASGQAIPEGELVAFHKPNLGSVPMSDGECLLIPLWLPLSAVLGWLVIRELRWREKRAKSADES